MYSQCTEYERLHANLQGLTEPKSRSLLTHLQPTQTEMTAMTKMTAKIDLTATGEPMGNIWVVAQNKPIKSQKIYRLWLERCHFT